MAELLAAHAIALPRPFTVGRTAQRRHSRTIKCHAAPSEETGRRELILKSVNLGVLGSLFTFGAAPRPSGLGVKDYGGGVKTLSLCPPSPNCISTAEEANDPTHYVPAWSYAPEDGKKRSREQAKAELVEAVTSTKPDNFTPTIVQQTDDYVYAEYQSPTFGFIDDVEFWFPAARPGTVEYRSASRIGESDGDINRKRIRTLRKELEKKGWQSVGF